MSRKVEAFLLVLFVIALLSVSFTGLIQPVIAEAQATEKANQETGKGAKQEPSSGAGQDTGDSWYLLEVQKLPGGLGGYNKDGITVYQLVYRPTRVMYTFITTEGDRHFGNGSAVGGVALTEMTDPTPGKPLLYEGDFK